MLRYSWKQRGFALPTVLISSVVMLTIMAVSVSSVATVRVTLKEQYYEQLAKTAGEAGVAYAKACLAKNNNVPSWTEANPLTPATNCQGIALPGSPSAYVISGDEYRSSFRVGLPVLNSEGRAATIPHTGFVQLLRKSDGTPWRTYTQPATQGAVVPDLCSGAATSALGWRNAHRPSTQDLLLTGPGSSAQSIVADSPEAQSGYAYFRKDFYVSSGGSYRVTARTNNGQTDRQAADVYINGEHRLVGVYGTQVTSGGLVLEEGCHTITIRTHNKTLIPSDSRVVAAVYKVGANTPVVATDGTWRVNTGELRHYSESGYNDDSTYAWSPVINGGLLSQWTAASGTTGNSTARHIRPSYGYSGGNNPAPYWYYFRSPNDFVIPGSTNADVRLSTICDNECDVYIDGVKYMNGSAYPSVSSSVITLTPGRHRVGVAVHNSGSTSNPVGFTMSIVSGSTTLMETNTDWVAANTYRASQDSWMSYDMFFAPSPIDIPIETKPVEITASYNSSTGNIDLNYRLSSQYSSALWYWLSYCTGSPSCTPDTWNGDSDFGWTNVFTAPSSGVYRFAVRGCSPGGDEATCYSRGGDFYTNTATVVVP